MGSNPAMNQRSRSRLGVRHGIGFVSLVVHLLACTTVFGQSAPPTTRLQTFHIRGTIRTAAHPGDYVQGAKVTFAGQNARKTISTNKQGFYEVDLPVGTYTMDVEPSEESLQEYQRPLFRVALPTSLTLDVILDPQIFCDPGVPAPGHVPADYSPCREVDLFSVPSEDGIPFQVLIRCFARWKTESGYAYGAVNNPVFVAYNLFTLRADHVTYDVQAKILRASGRVVTTNSDGATQRADSMAFKIENGQAFPLH